MRRNSVKGFYDKGLPLNESQFPERLQSVEARIELAAARSGRKRSEITLVAVSKKFSAAAIREAYSAGLRQFGENYVQEFADKKPELAGLADAQFHLIGHLQSNKARLAASLFQIVETVDSVRLLQRLDSAAQEKNTTIEVLFEIKLSEEQSKTGAPPEEIPALIDAAANCSNVAATGLMTMPPWSENPETSRPYFRQLTDLARRHKLPKLSMGMSNDFEVAIEEGTTIIRVGTALFGRRPKL